ncbi:MAG: hypothetical protein RJB13_1818 [Pseudomonadota bacterium]|jgi:hypothetical protein
MQFKTKKYSLLGLLGAAMWISTYVIPTSCGRRAPELRIMKVNDRASVMPIPVEASLSHLPSTPPEKILINMSSGSKLVSADSGAIVRFYYAGDDDVPAFEVASSEFSTMHLRTGCASSDVELLDNGFDSDMLICDGSLDVSKVVRMELEFPNGKVKSATSFSPGYLQDNVLSISVMFH